MVVVKVWWVMVVLTRSFAFRSPVGCLRAGQLRRHVSQQQMSQQQSSEEGGARPSLSSGPAPAVGSSPQVKSLEANAKLREDIARFKQAKVKSSAEKNSPLSSLVNGLGLVLSVNFVIIVALFLWFLYGCFSLYALSNDAAIIAVKAAFDPFILPLLSTHMGLTFLAAALERVAKPDDDDDEE